jgi:hypothetical protein
MKRATDKRRARVAARLSLRARRNASVSRRGCSAVNAPVRLRFEENDKNEIFSLLGAVTIRAR